MFCLVLFVAGYMPFENSSFFSSYTVHIKRETKLREIRAWNSKWNQFEQNEKKERRKTGEKCSCLFNV